MKLPKLRWRKPPETRILNVIEKHVALCTSISTELIEATARKIAGNRAEAERHIERLCQMEVQADGLRREVAVELAKGVLPPLSREVLIHLIKNLDMVADWAKDAARILRIIPADELTKGFERVLKRMVAKADLCVHTLGSSVIALYEDYQQAVAECDEVERIEEEIDDLYIEALRVIHDSHMETPMLVTELVRAVEMMADQCEDTADLIRIVIISTLH
jgi:predicted phosphate transport protein (TIGR00153 family)